MTLIDTEINYKIFLYSSKVKIEVKSLLMTKVPNKVDPVTDRLNLGYLKNQLF